MYDNFRVRMLQASKITEPMEKKQKIEVALTFAAYKLWCCCFIRFNSEYIGSIPFFLLLFYMSYRGVIRRQGCFKNFWINKERDARIEVRLFIRIDIVSNSMKFWSNR